jgi:hypothetical protein
MISPSSFESNTNTLSPTWNFIQAKLAIGKWRTENGKLIDNWKHLTNAEILSIQLKEFEKWYELAIAHYQSQLIVIHGVGKGKLRDEIHDILRLKREVKSFVNQYHPSFGYGATEIYFQF